MCHALRTRSRATLGPPGARSHLHPLAASDRTTLGWARHIMRRRAHASTHGGDALRALLVPVSSPAPSFLHLPRFSLGVAAVHCTVSRQRAVARGWRAVGTAAAAICGAPAQRGAARRAACVPPSPTPPPHPRPHSGRPARPIARPSRSASPDAATTCSPAPRPGRRRARLLRRPASSFPHARPRPRPSRAAARPQAPPPAAASPPRRAPPPPPPGEPARARGPNAIQFTLTYISTRPWGVPRAPRAATVGNFPHNSGP